MPESRRALAAREDGLSLIEMLFAILILGVALAAFASSMVSSLQAVQRDQRLVVANALATEVIEDLQGLPWEQAALFDDDAIDAFGGTTFDGEDLVLVTTPGPLVPDAVETLTRDGIDYEVTRAITWVDDAADGLEDDNADDDSQDYKRFTVDLVWSIRDRPHELRVSALRSAETRERPLRVEAPDEVLLNSAACNVAEFNVTATTLEPAQSVVVSYGDRDPSAPDNTLPLSDLAGDRRTWTGTFPAASPPACARGPFPDGPVIFTFEAQDWADPSVSYDATDMVVFHRPLDITVDVPETVEVDPVNGGTCADLTATIDVDGGTVNDEVTLTWAPTGPDPVELGPESDTRSMTDQGAQFTHTYPAGTQFGPEGETTLTVEVVRGYDGESVDNSDNPRAVQITELDEGCP